MNKNKMIIIELLKDMEEYAKMKNIKCPPLYLLGGSCCIVAEYLNRTTLDIDILNMDYKPDIGLILRLLDNYDILDIELTTIAEGFEIRSQKLSDFKYIDINVLSREDIILTKIGRYSKKDKEDIGKLIKQSDIDLILQLIENVKQRTNLSKIIKNEFIKNVGKFKEDYCV